eukprot:2087921-Prymnesium_polylepis.3
MVPRDLHILNLLLVHVAHHSDEYVAQQPDAEDVHEEPHGGAQGTRVGVGGRARQFVAVRVAEEGGVHSEERVAHQGVPLDVVAKGEVEPHGEDETEAEHHADEDEHLLDENGRGALTCLCVSHGWGGGRP